MKIIFLDFDGVLNTEAWQRHCLTRRLSTEDRFGPVFDPEAVANLSSIIAAVPDVGIVITSSWKWEGVEKMKRLWQKRGLPGTLLGITPDYVPDFDEGTLERVLQGELPVCRGAEIVAWQEQNNAQDCPYVIFDDLPDFYPEQQPYYIKTDPHIGITGEDASTAIKILRGW